MPTKNLTDAHVRAIKHADGEIIDAKTGLIARADREGRLLSAIATAAGPHAGVSTEDIHVSSRARIVIGTDSRASP